MKTKYLIICTYRTGSTLLCDLIHRQYGLTNYNEYLTSFDNKSRPSILETGKLSDLETFTAETNKRVNFLNQSDNWIVKIPAVNPSYFYMEFIQQCKKDPAVEIIFLYRKDIVAQLLSSFNASYRRILLQHPSNVFTKDTIVPTYNKIELNEHTIHGILLALSRRLVMWRMMYDLYGEGCKLLSYEDNILNFDLKCLGIEQNASDFIKTPHSASLSQDIWYRSVDFINQYKYTVDI